MIARLRRQAGFTLVEIMVSLAVVGATGGMIFSAIRLIALLGAKNSAINLTHQQTRAMIHESVSQIHSSISIPSLADTSLASVTGAGPAAAVTYQTLVAGPYRVWTSAAAGSSVIQVDSHTGDPVPKVGERLIVTAFRIEEDITAVASAGGSPPNYNITIANPITSAITCSSGTPNIVAYRTQRSALAVIGTELRYFPRSNAAAYSVIARSIVTPTPFSVPGSDNRYIQANFTAQDPRIAGLNMKSMFTQLQITVPYRYRLTTKQ